MPRPPKPAARAAASPTSAVDLVNFLLIWTTLGLALAWPFQLFLFSYIVIGPLHYTTEINWLDKQHYFLRPADRRPFVWTMAGLVLLLTMCVVAEQAGSWKATKPIADAVAGSGAFRHMLRWSWTLALLAFVAAAAWLFTDRWAWRLAIISICLASSSLFYAMPTVATIFGTFLPTIGHVYFFTVLFMLYGAIKARSALGYVNIVSMIAAAAVIVAWPMQVTEDSHLSDTVNRLTNASQFLQVDLAITKWLGLQHNGKIPLYSAAFFKVQAFVAFAYTYHYLNWFSKTSIIKWHQVEKKKFVYSGILWAASVALYAVNFQLGFAAIFALSVLHIVLEFPLNFVSMRAIYAAVFAKAKAAPAAGRLKSAAAR